MRDGIDLVDKRNGKELFEKALRKAEFHEAEYWLCEYGGIYMTMKRTKKDRPKAGTFEQSRPGPCC